MKPGAVTLLSFVGMIAIGATAFVAQNSAAADVAILPTPTAQAITSPLATVTVYASPTPTLQSVETLQAELSAARDAEYQTRLELANLIDAHAEITQQARADIIRIAEITETAKAQEIKAAEITATVIPVMATEAEAVRLYQLKQNEFAEKYPAIVREKADSEAYSKRADVMAGAEVFLRFAFGFSIISLSSLLVFVIVYRNGKPQPQPQGLVNLGELERQQEQRQMFFRQTVNEHKEPVQKRMTLEIPCDDVEFMEFARCVIQEKRRLSFPAWNGHDLYKRLGHLRNWMRGEGFAEPVPNHEAELWLTADGERYLTDSLAEKKPLPPYYCRKNQTSNEGE